MEAPGLGGFLLMLRAFVILFAGVSAAVVAAPATQRNVPARVATVSPQEVQKLQTLAAVEALLKTCPARSMPTVIAPATNSTAAPSLGCVQPADLKLIDVYRLHNQVRAQAGSPPLVWDPQLALQAAAYVPTMANGRPVHSGRKGRETSRENLAPVLAGSSTEKMVGLWLAERRNFVPGIFPAVSRTGNWADVGHYTQMIWPTTTNLGCAIHKGQPFDWLVCRYSPPGNQDGKPVPANVAAVATTAASGK
jgi:hypothetical protein